MPQVARVDKRSLVTFTSTIDGRQSNRECGTERECSNSAAAPATVSGEPEPQCHWARSREGGDGHGPASQETYRRCGRSRAGCLGKDRIALHP